MKTNFLLLALFIGHLAIARNPIPLRDSSTLNVTANKAPITVYKSYSQRKWLVGSGSVNGSMGTLKILKGAWYKNYPKSSFHTFNDDGEWLQMDKFGHAWSAYNLSHATSALWKWAKVPDKNAVLLGSLSSLSYMTVIEYLDGHSAGWGWSWGDITANSFGTVLYASQQLGWNEQRIQYKFSFHPHKYDATVQKRADYLFGKSLPAEILKDYNKQTYWFSFNLDALLATQKLPSWLSVAVGYGAEGMFGGFDNRVARGELPFNGSKIKRYRQWYLAPDVDLTKIKTNNKTIRTVLEAINTIKFPLPGLEYSNNKLKGHWLQF